MENIKIQVQHDCPVCNALGKVENLEYDPEASFPTQSPYRQCENCNGKKVITEFVLLDTLLAEIAKMEISI